MSRRRQRGRGKQIISVAELNKLVHASKEEDDLKNVLDNMHITSLQLYWDHFHAHLKRPRQKQDIIQHIMWPHLSFMYQRPNIVHVPSATLEDTIRMVQSNGNYDCLGAISRIHFDDLRSYWTLKIGTKVPRTKVTLARSICAHMMESTASTSTSSAEGDTARSSDRPDSTSTHARVHEVDAPKVATRKDTLAYTHRVLSELVESETTYRGEIARFQAWLDDLLLPLLRHHYNPENHTCLLKRPPRQSVRRVVCRRGEMSRSEHTLCRERHNFSSVVELLETIASHLQVLVRLSDQFLAAVGEGGWPASPDANLVLRAFDGMIRSPKWLETYQRYILDSDTAIILFEKWDHELESGKMSPPLRNILRPRLGLLERTTLHYLVLPVQRVPRYVMLMNTVKYPALASQVSRVTSHLLTFSFENRYNPAVHCEECNAGIPCMNCIPGETPICFQECAKQHYRSVHRRRAPAHVRRTLPTFCTRCNSTYWSRPREHQCHDSDVTSSDADAVDESSTRAYVVEEEEL